MNREIYLKQLQKYLKRLPKEDYEQAMEYFKEHFEDAGPEKEQEVIEELGSPKEAAAELLKNLLDQKTDNPETGKKSSAGKNILIAVLAMLAAPVGVPVLLAGLLILFAGVLLMAALIFCAFAVIAAAVLSGGKMLIRGLVAIPYSVSGFCIISGSGLLLMGLAVIVCLALCRLCVLIEQGIVSVVKKFLQKRRS